MTSRPTAIWSEIYPVRSYDVDTRGMLSVASICNFLQDAAGCHAHALGLSVDQLRSRHLTWVLVRMRLDLDRHLRWQDNLHIKTWPSHQERLFSHRDFLLFDEEQAEVGRCVTVWVLMDLQSWRPQRLTKLPEPLPIPGRPRAMATLPGKIEPPDALATQCQFQVGHRDLDRNGHVNNVRYIEWALEAVPMTVRNTFNLKTLEVNFTGEAFHAESIIAGCQTRTPAPYSYWHQVNSQTSQTELARVKSQWAAGAAPDSQKGK